MYRKPYGIGNRLFEGVLSWQSAKIYRDGWKGAVGFSGALFHCMDWWGNAAGQAVSAEIMRETCLINFWGYGNIKLCDLVAGKRHKMGTA